MNGFNRNKWIAMERRENRFSYGIDGDVDGTKSKTTYLVMVLIRILVESSCENHTQ